MSSIYLVLDMMNDLINEKGPNGNNAYGVQAREHEIISRTSVALKKARAADVRVGYVRVGFSSDYRECPAHSPIFAGAPKSGLFKLGTWGTEVHPDISPRDGDFDFVKHRVSPFCGTSLDLVLRTNRVRRIYCSGISTNAVVQAIVREGHDRDYEMIVLEDCCSATTLEEHALAVESLKRFAQFTTSDEICFK